MRSAEVRRAERAWLTPELARGQDGLDALWLALVLLNLAAIVVWPSWDTVPFHLISTGSRCCTRCGCGPLARLDAATVLADAERLGLAMDALLENAIRHTRDGDPIQLSVTGPGGPGSAWP